MGGTDLGCLVAVTFLAASLSAAAPPIQQQDTTLQPEKSPAMAAYLMPSSSSEVPSGSFPHADAPAILPDRRNHFGIAYSPGDRRNGSYSGYQNPFQNHHYTNRRLQQGRNV